MLRREIRVETKVTPSAVSECLRTRCLLLSGDEDNLVPDLCYARRREQVSANEMSLDKISRGHI